MVHIVAAIIILFTVTVIVVVLVLVCVLKQKKIVDRQQHKEVTGSDSIYNSYYKSIHCIYISPYVHKRWFI